MTSQTAGFLQTLPGPFVVTEAFDLGTLYCSDRLFVKWKIIGVEDEKILDDSVVRKPDYVCVRI